MRAAGLDDRDRVIVSIGGNALLRRASSGTIEEQFRSAGEACAVIAELAAKGSIIAVTHGNGPIVGNILIRNEAAKDVVAPMPLYICGADSEGGIGFMLQQAIYNGLQSVRRPRDVVTVVTQVVVDEKDPAFGRPTKPVGPYYAAREAGELKVRLGWDFSGDAARGLRRVVPSPRPKRIVEAAPIKALLEMDAVVIAAGGGGVPVVENKDGSLAPVDAVVDKDYSTSLLAREIKATTLINLTEVDMVYLDYGKPGQRGLARLTVDEALRYLAEGQFAAGSMGPKVESAVEFLASGGKEVIITTPGLARDALAGRAGTMVCH